MTLDEGFAGRAGDHQQVDTVPEPLISAPQRAVDGGCREMTNNIDAAALLIKAPTEVMSNDSSGGNHA